MPFAAEVRVGVDAQLEQQVRAAGALAAEPQSLAVLNGSGNLDGQFLAIHAKRDGAAQGRRQEGNGDFGLDLLGRPLPTASAPAARPPAEGFAGVAAHAAKLAKDAGQVFGVEALEVEAARTTAAPAEATEGAAARPAAGTGAGEAEAVELVRFSLSLRRS